MEQIFCTEEKLIIVFWSIAKDEKTKQPCSKAQTTG